MGIPYSKQINNAFDEVTPLVAAGFRVLRTSRNISILLAAIQVVNTLLLSLAVIGVLALLITVNPDLDDERRTVVTPAVKWCAAWLVDRVWLRIVLATTLIGCALGGVFGWAYTRDVLEKNEALNDGGLRADEPLEGADGDANHKENVGQ